MMRSPAVRRKTHPTDWSGWESPFAINLEGVSLRLNEDYAKDKVGGHLGHGGYRTNVTGHGMGESFPQQPFHCPERWFTPGEFPVGGRYRPIGP